MSSHISAINNEHSKAKVMILNIYTFLMLAGVWKIVQKKNNLRQHWNFIAFYRQEVAFF